MLLGIDPGWNKLLQIALIRHPLDPDHRLLIVIHDQAILRSIQPKLMQSGPHLRRKGEVSCRCVGVYDHSQFINKLCLSNAFQKRARETICEDFKSTTLQKLSDLTDAMANVVLQQTAGQLPDPVIAVP